MNDTLGIFLSYLMTIGYFIVSYYITDLCMKRMKESDEEFLNSHELTKNQ